MIEEPKMRGALQHVPQEVQDDDWRVIEEPSRGTRIGRDRH